jgi:hypothetical protein
LVGKSQFPRGDRRGLLLTSFRAVVYSCAA